MRNPKPTRVPIKYAPDNVTPAPWGGPVTIEQRYQWPPLAWLANIASQTDDLYVYERSPDGSRSATQLSFEPQMLPTLVVKALRLRTLAGHGEIVAIESGATTCPPMWFVDVTVARDNLDSYRFDDDAEIDLAELLTEQEVAAAELWCKHNG